MNLTDNITNTTPILGNKLTMVDCWVILALIIVGVLIILVSKRSQNRWTMILGPALIIAAIFSIFIKSFEFRDIMVAFASIFAVIFSAVSIYQSEKIRKDTLEKEAKDRKERYLDEIISWANDVNTKVYDYDLFRDDIGNNYLNLSNVSHGLLNKGIFIKSISEIALKNEKLTNSVIDTCHEIAIFGASCRYFANGVVGGKFSIAKMTKEEKVKYTKELDSAIKSTKKNKKTNIDVIAGKLEDNMREKANITLQVCVMIKKELLE
jgi:hypothetical protein